MPNPRNARTALAATLLSGAWVVAASLLPAGCDRGPAARVDPPPGPRPAPVTSTARAAPAAKPARVTESIARQLALYLQNHDERDPQKRTENDARQKQIEQERHTLYQKESQP